MNTTAYVDTTGIERIHHNYTYTSTSLDSNSQTILTDFHFIKPLVITSDLLAIEAEKLMRQSHVRFKLVTNASNQWVGTISLKELNNEAIIKKVSEGESRNDILVSDLMTHKTQTLCLEFDQFKFMTIRKLLSHLKDSNLTHCLIADSPNGEIRGLISASHIAKSLHIDTLDYPHIDFHNLFVRTTKPTLNA
ncbi:hypothetical protein [Marinicellulosiphila megalodicopiae]|uniref:hypothetical protein n=1 Tax=Marinicellulosiphila megalodicopiae TaxID=2724896 RepID=UPI003BB0D2E4